MTFGQRIQDFLAGIDAGDAELAEELRRLAQAPTAQESALPLEPYAAETIVLRAGRPVLAVARGEAELVFTDNESRVWDARLRKAAGRLRDPVAAVGRIEVQGHPRLDWIGTGWLVDSDIVVTNRHVAREFAEQQGDGFRFLSSPGGGRIRPSLDFLKEIAGDESLDVEVVDVLHIEPDQGADLAFLKLRRAAGVAPMTPVSLSTAPVAAQQLVAVVGYPARDSRIPETELMDRIFGNVYNKKRLAPGQIVESAHDVLRHDCSTLGGNSGSAVIDLQSGAAVGLHFAGRFLEANFAVPSVVVSRRLDALGKRGSRSGAPPPSETSILPGSQETDVARHATTVQAPSVFFGSAASLTIPLTITVAVGDTAPATPLPTRTDTAGSPASLRLRRHNPAQADEYFVDEESRPEDYDDREGFSTNFLGEQATVDLPTITGERADDVLQFGNSAKESVLRYEHFSVVMSRSRRLCLVSAVNIDGRTVAKRKRTGWRIDPRIPREQQIRDECYGNEPKFARGHMTRREDPVWGKRADRGNSDSMHVTNTVPQMQPFNAGIWLALEDYALDHAREDDMRITVFTGPFLLRSDREQYGVKIPRSFWKVIAFIHDETGELCATGYSLSQEDFLREEEFVFGRHETTQLPIATIERRAGISFKGLSDLDPLSDNEEALSPPLTDPFQIVYVPR